jgi:hypothetical protein
MNKLIHIAKKYCRNQSVKFPVYTQNTNSENRIALTTNVSIYFNKGLRYASLSINGIDIHLITVPESKCPNLLIVSAGTLHILGSSVMPVNTVLLTSASELV